MTDKKWAQPTAVDDVLFVFPGSVSHLMPPMAEIPPEFKEFYNPWARVASKWFALGLKGTLVPKEGIDKKAALRHLATVLRSFEPRHEHKEAAVAYLLSLWFDRYEEA